MLEPACSSASPEDTSASRGGAIGRAAQRSMVSRTFALDRFCADEQVQIMLAISGNDVA
jgi:hypothetical protein